MEFCSFYKAKKDIKLMSPYLEVLFLTCLFGVTFIIVLPSFCQDLGFSAYFVSSRVDQTTIDNENNRRVIKARKILSSLERSFLTTKRREKFHGRNRSILDFVVVVISIKRRSNPHYLLQSAVRLMSEVQGDRASSEMLIFNADKHPEQNQDAEMLSRFVKVVKSSTSTVTDDVFENEKRDYMNALHIGLQSSSRFVLVVQDDALATTGILRKLRYILKWKMPWKWLRSTNSQNWAFLKLYYPEKWQGFGTPEIPELILIGVLGALCFTTFRQKILKLQRTNLGKKIWWLWCVSGLFYFILVAYTVGRVHWIEMRKVFPLFYSVGDAPGCCIPAVLFPAKQAQKMVEFLNRTECRNGYPVDIAFEDFVKENDLKGLLVSPNLFTHIGFHSSLHSYDKNTKEFKLLFELWPS